MLPEHLECRAVRLRPHKDSVIPVHVQIKLSSTNINPSLSLKCKSIKKLKEAERARKLKATGCRGGKGQVCVGILRFLGGDLCVFFTKITSLCFSFLTQKSSSRIHCAIRRVKKISICKALRTVPST